MSEGRSSHARALRGQTIRRVRNPLSSTVRTVVIPPMSHEGRKGIRESEIAPSNGRRRKHEQPQHAAFIRGRSPPCAAGGGSRANKGSEKTPSTASAAGYPTKPIRLLVGVAPGGGTDFAARLIAQKLNEVWGQPVVVDNRIGATGLIAMETVAKAPADGYTYIVFNIAHLTYACASLSRRTSFDTATAFTPVSQIATGSMMLAVHPAVPGGTLSEFVAHAKSRPGAMAYASGGPASMQQLAMELFKREARIDLLHVPGHRGSARGTVQATITNILALYPHVKAGRLKGIAIASAKRSALAAEVPTFSELGYPKVDVNVAGIMGPAGAPGDPGKARARDRGGDTLAGCRRRAGSAGRRARRNCRASLPRSSRTSARWLQLIQETKITVD